MKTNEKYYLAFWVVVVILSIFMAVSCTKPPDDCDCATITRGYEPMEWYRLEWCNGDTVRIWVVDSSWQIKDTDCYVILAEFELLK